MRRPHVARLVSAGDYNLSPRGLSEAQTLVFAESNCLDPSLRFSSPRAWALQGFLDVPRVRLCRSRSRCLASPGIISLSRRTQSGIASLRRRTSLRNSSSLEPSSPQPHALSLLNHRVFGDDDDSAFRDGEALAVFLEVVADLGSRWNMDVLVDDRSSNLGTRGRYRRSRTARCLRPSRRS